MKQLLQSVRTGEISIAEVPPPQLRPQSVLVRMAASLVSAGTERAVCEFARKALIQKARSRPELTRQLITKFQRDGLLSAIRAAQSRLDRPQPLGYSNAGTVMAVAEDIHDIQVGDRVACAGAGYACHAEIVCVPRLLLVRIPEAVAEPKSLSFEEAAFAALGAVALHGVRTSGASLGEIVAVIGLGLIGQLTVLILKAAGCVVAGLDILRDRTESAKAIGADFVAWSESDFVELVRNVSAGRGADRVLITAETPSSQPVHLAGEVARDRAVVTAVGTVGLDIERKQYYQKELDFRISRSCGPGRYDPEYEEKARDYPSGYVRWTENRNLQAFLGLMVGGQVNVRPLITHKFPIEQAESAYELITGDGGIHSLGVILTYKDNASGESRSEPQKHFSAQSTLTKRSAIVRPVKLGVLGAGQFAVGTLLPAIASSKDTNLVGICAASGISAHHAARKFGFEYLTCDETAVTNDPQIDTVLICTRHHLHARQVLSALSAGKNVFCEKPLCLSKEELTEIARALCGPVGLQTQKPRLLIGYNRRFSPMVTRIKEFFVNCNEPLLMHYRVNAGYISQDHWVQDHDQGGGRIVGEVCHFVDLLSFISGSTAVGVAASATSTNGRYGSENVIISLAFANGSQANITYAANGDTSISKERLEIFGAGSTAMLDDFRRLLLARNGHKSTFHSLLHQDKGHRAEWEAFTHALLSDGPPPISYDHLISTSLVTFQIVNSLREGKPVEINTPEFISNALATEPPNASDGASGGKLQRVLAGQQEDDFVSAVG
jgi:predicted dehydrogenase/threonine dehydrogenase-like Zn-dependent dehydrogenase